MQYQNLYHNQCCTLQRYQLSVAIFCVRWHGLNELKGRWLLTVKELQKTIMEKGRMLYERITGYLEEIMKIFKCQEDMLDILENEKSQNIFREAKTKADCINGAMAA
jgi:hypothetical protein